MAGQQRAIYNSYVKRVTANNVEPTIVKGNKEVFDLLRESVTGFDFDKPFSHDTYFWDHTSKNRAFKFDDGRIGEYSTDNSAFRIPLLAIFDKHDDWFNYRQPMGMFHYLYT